MPRQNYRPFVIVTRSRTGSNLLVSLLDSHPSVICKGEIVGRVGRRSPADVLDRLFRPRLVDQVLRPFRGDIEAVGFKAFYYHPLDLRDTRPLWEYLADLDDLKVVHLTRRNVLRTILSRAIAGKQEVWTNRHDHELPLTARRVTLDARHLERQFQQTRGWENACRERFSNHSLLEVVYEDLAEATELELDRVLGHLGVSERQDLSTPLRRQNPEPIDELIANYEELVEYFTGTEWEEFFVM